MAEGTDSPVTAAAEPPPAAASANRLGCMVYPFFGVHMLGFGISGFVIAYQERQPDLGFLFMHGGIAIAVYLVFYLAIFGRDQVKWMLINGALGVFGIHAQIGWILARFGRNIDDYPWQAHVIPMLYYVLYTFLLRQFVIDATRSRGNPARRRAVEMVYVLASVLVYGLILWRARTSG